MKVKDIIKKQTTVIALAVVLVAITVIGVSYAIFFDVKTNTNNQVITAGTLKLTVSDISALQLSEPMSTSSGLASTSVSYTVKNTDSNLPAAYSIYIYADSSNAMDLSKIKISLDGNATSGSTAVVLSSITDTFTENGITYFKIDSGNLDAGASASTKYLRVWVDEDLLTDELTNVAVSLNMYIISEVYEPGTSASEQIISLAGNGQVFDEGNAGYRYEGLNVDNYVEFNNETWRILAVEEGSKIGLTSGEYYIKLIRDESMGNLAWDTNNSNVWSTSTLYSILNNDYLNRSGDYASTGISSEAKEYITKANWYTNSASSVEYTASEFYSYERSDLTNYVNNYVGLMYPSDYGYASPTSTCGSTTLYGYSGGCYESNWLFKNDNFYWTITPFSSSSSLVFFVCADGSLRSYSYGAYDGSGARPSVYLKSDISFVEGTTGSSSNMFKIAE